MQYTLTMCIYTYSTYGGYICSCQNSSFVYYFCTVVFLLLSNEVAKWSHALASVLIPLLFANLCVCVCNSHNNKNNNNQNVEKIANKITTSGDRGQFILILDITSEQISSRFVVVDCVHTHYTNVWPFVRSTPFNFLHIYTTHFTSH